MEINTLAELEAEVDKVFLMKDRGVVRMVVATVVANRMNYDPVWLLLVAGSSAGKTELINCVTGLNFVELISDLTVNSLLSGQKVTGKETSLLFRVNNGILAFKDFTSILSKNKETRGEILKQLREVYDGDYTKQTGTGYNPKWKGKVGAIAGSTEAIYRYLEDFSIMGDRFIMYSIDAPDRLEAARRQMQNSLNMKEKREHLKKCFTSFITKCLDALETHDDTLRLSPAVEDDLLLVADFAAQMRSAVVADFKSGLTEFVPAKEMPMRIISQLTTLAAAFVLIDKVSGITETDGTEDSLTEFEMSLLYKTALDSIPRTRRDILKPLAQYAGGASTAGLAAYLDLPTESVKKYLAQVNALGACTRSKRGGKQGDMWRMRREYRELMCRLGGVDAMTGMLLAQNVENEKHQSESIDVNEETEALNAIEIWKKELDDYDRDVLEGKPHEPTDPEQLSF